MRTTSAEAAAKILIGLTVVVMTSGWSACLAQARKPAEPARPAAPAAQADSLESRFWNSIQGGDVASDFRTYLDAYPNGQYAAQARARLRELEAKAGASPGPGRVVIKPAPEPARPAPTPPATQAGAPAGVVRDCETCPALVPIPAGTFMMGSTEFFPFEAPVHQVSIRKPFYLGQREVTFDEWDACVAEGGCAFSPSDRGAGRGSRPVGNVDWNDAQQFVGWLSKKTGKAYRLPTESEWEFAARAGTTTTYPWGKAMEKGKANCMGCNPEPSANAVATGSYPPNAYGLYDMVGNVAEWVEDCWNDSFKSAPTDGSAWTKPRCQERVLRGGSFNNDQRYVRSASRYKYDYDVRFYANGLRVARDL
ncbi:formylglycine-generating enzyme family protein [Alsobacter sp. KACC 23698]|uniref:Formylglycine-generating enzyme family protein n=1 Tax=Alsobacter sp. KACC 23698 TaxID=3149229 RepID=A0AAU7JMF6_9HYPH